MSNIRRVQETLMYDRFSYVETNLLNNAFYCIKYLFSFKLSNEVREDFFTKIDNEKGRLNTDMMKARIHLLLDKHIIRTDLTNDDIDVIYDEIRAYCNKINDEIHRVFSDLRRQIEKEMEDE
jgi:hypothetical protein